MDKVSVETRSGIMAKVRSKGNRSTEVKLRSCLAGSGIGGFRLNAPGLPGRPDFVFDCQRVAVFVDGCFWHGCPNCYRRPASSQEYWDSKVLRNKERDIANNAKLEELGWKSLRIWEHELANLAAVRERIRLVLNG